MLSEQQAVEIYTAKISLRAQSQDTAPNMNQMRVIKGRSVRVALIYGVTSRTIRDIWNRRSWGWATRHLWCLEPQLGENVLSIPTIKVLLHPSCHLFSAQLVKLGC